MKKFLNKPIPSNPDKSLKNPILKVQHSPLLKTTPPNLGYGSMPPPVPSPAPSIAPASSPISINNPSPSPLKTLSNPLVQAPIFHSPQSSNVLGGQAPKNPKFFRLMGVLKKQGK